MSFLRRRREDRAVAEELKAHIEEHVDELVESGMKEEDARHIARKQLGNRTQLRERIHEQNGIPLLDAIGRDLSVSLRSLARRPWFALGVALTLGLGIGAATMVYTVVDHVLLAPLPYEDPDTLVAIGALNKNAEWVDHEGGLQQLEPMSLMNFLELEERARSYQDLATIMLDEIRFGAGENGSVPDRVQVAGISQGFLETLHATPHLGRLFRPEEYTAATPKVLLLSYGTWQRRYGGDPDIIGRTETRLEASMTIVGVLPQNFVAPEAFFPRDEVPEFWGPLDLSQLQSSNRVVRTSRDLYLLGRLAAGVTAEQARGEAAQIASVLVEENPGDYVRRDGATVGIGVNGLHAQTLGTVGGALGMFLVASALLLLLAMMNVATILLARALERTREFGVRMALGAGRARIVRLLLSEAGLLTVMGAGIGILLALGGISVFRAYAPLSIPRMEQVVIDARVLFVAAIVSLLTGVVVGVMPALRLTGRRPWQRLNRHGVGEGGASSRTRSVLVGGQIAIAVVLLSVAALLFQSFVHLQGGGLGLDPDGLIAMDVEIKGAPSFVYEQTWLSWDVLLDELHAVPGIESVALTSNVPFQYQKWKPTLLLPGESPDQVHEGTAGYAVTPGFFETVGARRISGRDVSDEDQPSSERVALVNEAFAQRYFGQSDPIGQTLRWLPGYEWTPESDWSGTPEWRAAQPTPMRIIGVVENIVQMRVGEPPQPAIYVPYTQMRPFSPSALVRSSLPAEAIFPALRQAVARYNSWENALLDLGYLAPTDAAALQFRTLLISAFAAIAILLAAVGLYGTMTHFVGRRQREFGVRMAMGARPARVFCMVLRQGLLLAGAGLVAGLLVTLLSTNALASFLFGVEPNDPFTLTMAGSVLLLTALASCYLPARRATSIDPATVLREE